MSGCARGLDSLKSINPQDFVIRAEEYGVPQTRHRVILLGVREDILPKQRMTLEKPNHFATVEDALKSLPALRSRVSKQQDSIDLWQTNFRFY